MEKALKQSSDWQLAAIDFLAGTARSLIVALAIARGRLGIEEAMDVIRLEEILQPVEKTMQSKLEESRHATQQRLLRSLREYKNLFAVENRTITRLIYTDSLKLLPLHTLGIIKSLALRGGFGDCIPDERSAMGYEMMTMSIPRLLKLLYPTLLRMDEYLMQDCVNGMLKNKTVILVTHQIDFLHEADSNLVMRDGKIAQSRKYLDLLKPGTQLEALVSAHNESMQLVQSDLAGRAPDAPL